MLSQKERRPNGDQRACVASSGRKNDDRCGIRTHARRLVPETSALDRSAKRSYHDWNILLNYSHVYDYLANSCQYQVSSVTKSSEQRLLA